MTINRTRAANVGDARYGNPLSQHSVSHGRDTKPSNIPAHLKGKHLKCGKHQYQLGRNAVLKGNLQNMLQKWTLCQCLPEQTKN